jgi:arylformamidase
VRIADYPAQEPFSPAAQTYHNAVMRLGTGAEPVEELAYGDDPYQRIAVYPAARPDGTVLAFLHGGGWTNGYKEWLAFMAPSLATHGITFASIGYRLAPAHVFPAGLDDAEAAFARLHREIGRFGGDPARLFVGGHSAGGHYAALLAVRRFWRAARGPPEGAVRGCLPISGVYRFGEGSGMSMRPRFLGPPGTEAAASPILGIDPAPPPFLLAHGSDDLPHLATQAAAMAEALRQAGGTAELLVLPGRDHFTASYAAGEAAGPWLPAAVSWMRRH